MLFILQPLLIQGMTAISVSLPKQILIDAYHQSFRLHGSHNLMDLPMFPKARLVNILTTSPLPNFHHHVFYDFNNFLS